MSVPRTRNHAQTWTLCLLGALILYAATWPPIEIMAHRRAHWQAFMKYGVPDIIVEAPPWIDVVYGPMHRLRRTPLLVGPLSNYHTWWWNMLSRS